MRSLLLGRHKKGGVCSPAIVCIMVHTIEQQASNHSLALDDVVNCFPLP